MNETDTKPNGPELTEEQRLAKEKELLSKKYKAKGAQSMTLKEYEALKAKKAKARIFQIPGIVKLTISTPFFLIACFGVVFIPYMIFAVITGKSVPITEKEESSSSIFLNSDY